jgi:hypothetical protein
MLKPFLTANWRYLAMLNFVVEPDVLAPLVPEGTELDFREGRTFVSVVGFLFLDTRVMGLPIPRHRDFEEVNLRFYVRRKAADTWRRGVVFVRELVPKPAIAIVARAFYGEPYLAVPMRHQFTPGGDRFTIEYQWKRKSKWETLAMSASGDSQSSAQDSHEEFITEHYWGYTRVGNRVSEYRVEHTRWKYWPAESSRFEANVATLYGERFVETLTRPAFSAFLAEGSAVTVQRRRRELFEG